MSFSKSTFEVNFGKMHTEWEVATLQEVCLKEKGSIISGPFGSNISKKYFVDYGVPVIRGNNLTKDGVKFVDEGFVFVTEEKAESLKTYARINDLVFTAAGTIGQVGIINNKCKYKEYIISNKQLRATPDTNIVDPLYTYYWFSNPKMDTYINKLNTGSTIPLINLTILKGLPIPLPTIKEQKAIANILSSLDEKIELNNQMNKTLEEMAQALFKRWFVDFEFPNENGEPYKSSGGEMVDSELGMIPKGWRISALSDLCSLETKSEKPFDNKEVVYEHFSLPACDEGKLPVIEMGSEISSNKYKIDNECILISKLNPATKRIWNPTCTTENAICSTEFMVYRPKKVTEKSFCYEIINAERFTKFLLANVTGSTGSRQRTQPKKTLEYKIALGDTLIIEKFSDMMKPMHELVKNNIENNKVLRAKRDTLLPKLMSGEIRVTDLKN